MTLFKNALTAEEAFTVLSGPVCSPRQVRGLYEAAWKKRSKKGWVDARSMPREDKRVVVIAMMLVQQVPAQAGWLLEAC